MSKDILIISDTPYNRSYMRTILGDMIFNSKQNAYIKVDVVNGTWERTFTYQWVYMEKPELSSLEDVNNYIKIFKRREKLNNILES